MACCILRKVVYRLPERGRPVFAIELGQYQGLSILFVRRPNGAQDHCLAFAVENVEGNYFEAVNAHQIPMGQNELATLGSKLLAIADRLGQEEVERLLTPEDLI